MYASEYVQLQDLFTSSELERLMHRNERYESVRLKNQVTISLLIYQGFKLTKMTHLRVQDEDLEAGSIYVRSMIKTYPGH